MVIFLCMRARDVNKKLLKKLVRSEKNGRSKAAEAAGCSPHTISNWYRERYFGGIEEYHAVLVAKYFGVSVDLLFPPLVAEKKAS